MAWAPSDMGIKQINSVVTKEHLHDPPLRQWREAAGHRHPSPRNGEIVVFKAYLECGLRLPAHPFLAAVLEHFGVELVNLVPNSLTMIAVFVHLCEAYLGTPPTLELFKYYYGMQAKGESAAAAAGCCVVRLHAGKAKEYIAVYTKSSWSSWRAHWFYMTAGLSDRLRFAGRAATRSDAWDASKPASDRRIVGLVGEIGSLRARGLTGWHVVRDYVARGISPLKNRQLPLSDFDVLRRVKDICDKGPPVVVEEDVPQPLVAAGKHARAAFPNVPEDVDSEDEIPLAKRLKAWTACKKIGSSFHPRADEVMEESEQSKPSSRKEELTQVAQHLLEAEVLRTVKGMCKKRPPEGADVPQTLVHAGKEDRAAHLNAIGARDTVAEHVEDVDSEDDIPLAKLRRTSSRIISSFYPTVNAEKEQAVEELAAITADAAEKMLASQGLVPYGCKCFPDHFSLTADEGHNLSSDRTPRLPGISEVLRLMNQQYGELFDKNSFLSESLSKANEDKEILHGKIELLEDKLSSQVVVADLKIELEETKALFEIELSRRVEAQSELARLKGSMVVLHESLAEEQKIVWEQKESLLNVQAELIDLKRKNLKMVVLLKDHDERERMLEEATQEIKALKEENKSFKTRTCS